MFYVYALSSLRLKRIYIGYSTDLKWRYQEHLAGRVKTTKGYLPWKLVYYEAYFSKRDAATREKELKIHAAKKSLIERINRSINEADVKMR